MVRKAKKPNKAPANGPERPWLILNVGQRKMISQESMTEGKVVALWVGDFDSPEELDSYINGPFEEDFGFRMNDLAMPEVSEPSGATVPIKELLAGFSFYDGWIDGAVSACEEMKIAEAKAAVVFHHLRYREGLGRKSQTPLQFVANISWNA
jgi:hypothetical protein